MSEGRQYINGESGEGTQLVLPSGELMVVGITPDWNVEIGGRLNGVHLPEEAICISALARNINQPLLLTELTSAVVEERDVARKFSASENPIFKKLDLDDAVLTALGKLMQRSDSVFDKNIVLLGHGESKRVSLFANMQDFGYGSRKIEDFFSKNPDLKDLQRAYSAMFDREFNRIHGILQNSIISE